MLRRLAVLFCLAALVGIVPMYAGQWDKDTTVTFARSIELPGIMLPPGTYVFRLLDVPGNRHVVQVFNADATYLYTTILALPNLRLKPTGETVMRFDEARIGAPEPMRAWFYPGDSFGQEFVYPHKRAAELAATTHVPVLAAPMTPAETPEELINEAVVEVTPGGEEITTPFVTEETPVIAEALPAAEPAPEPAPQAAPAELPKTASPVPILLLIGFGSLGMAAGVRAIAKAVA